MDVREAPVVLTVDGLQALIELLRTGGMTVVGPTVRDGIVTHAEITGVDDLPRGVGDDQSAGHYRLVERGDEACFGYAVPAASWKRLLFPPIELIVAEGPRPDAEERPDIGEGPAGPYALFGVRSCDLHSLAVHDRVLLGRAAVDVRYARRRAGAVIVAVACTDPAATCFCASLGTGPDPDAGYDLKLTELLDGEHRFLAVAGSEAGAGLLAQLRSIAARPADLVAAAAAVRAAAERQTRTLPTDGLRETLYAAAEHPHWSDVAARCLACANCTLVCPTCFCTTVEDVSDLAGERVERRRVWDSCFTAEFSHLHGGSVRESVAARYRQWLTHKLAAWSDQFGTPGCVGCGRCVTWCPAGIDLLAEVAALREPWTTLAARAATEASP